MTDNPESFLTPEDIDKMAEEHAGQFGWDPEELAPILHGMANMTMAAVLASNAMAMATLMTSSRCTTDDLAELAKSWANRADQHVRTAEAYSRISAVAAFVRAGMPGL